MDWTNVTKDLVTIFVVVDPIGSIPVYLHAVSSVPQQLHKSYAVRAVFIATIVLLSFLVAGHLVLDLLGLRLGSFQVAGGLVLLLFALSMIFGTSKPESEIEEANRCHLSSAVFPLAIPSIASPGAMLALVVLTNSDSHAFKEKLTTSFLLLLVLAFTLVLLLAASRIQRLIGETGESLVSRIMGIILATIAVDSVFVGMEAMGAISLDRV